MAERWRKPIRIEAFESSVDTMRIGDREYRDYEVILSNHEDWERIRTGYVCIQCYEPHETPFPAACPVCGLTAQDQHDRIPVEHAGETWIGSHQSLADELEELAEKNDRRKFNRQSSIILPRNVRL